MWLTKLSNYIIRIRKRADVWSSIIIRIYKITKQKVVPTIDELSLWVIPLNYDGVIKQRL